MEYSEKYNPTSTKKYFNNYYIHLIYRLRKENNILLWFHTLKKLQTILTIRHTKKTLIATLILGTPDYYMMSFVHQFYNSSTLG